MEDCKGYWKDCHCESCKKREAEGGGDRWTEPDIDDWESDWEDNVD